MACASVLFQPQAGNAQVKPYLCKDAYHPISVLVDTFASVMYVVSKEVNDFKSDKILLNAQTFANGAGQVPGTTNYRVTFKVKINKFVSREFTADRDSCKTQSAFVAEVNRQLAARKMPGYVFGTIK